MPRVNVYLTVITLATVLCQILTVQGDVPGSCSTTDLPFETIKCQDVENNPVKPVGGAVSDGHLCIFTCTQNQQQTWVYCKEGQWSGEPEKCREDALPIATAHHRKKRWGRFFRRVFRAIKCVFSRCSRGRPRDTTRPQLTCPPNQNINGDPFQTHAKAYWVTPTAWDSRDGAVTVYKSTSRNSGFPISEPGAWIGFYAKDKSGNMARCRFRINVKVIRCPRLRRMTDGYAICHRSDDMVLGSYCIFGCYEGHQLIGPSYAKCMSTRLWSSWTVQPYCQKHSCDPLLPTSSLLSITRTDGDLFRSIATFSCGPGYDVPVGVRRVAVCEVDQTWSSTVPNCVDIERPSFKRFPSSKTFYIGRHDVTVAVYWENPEVEDNSGDTLTAVHISGPTQGDALAVGTYTVTYTATDRAGNTARPLNVKLTVREIRCFHVYPTPYTSVTCTGNRLGSTCTFNCSDGAKLNASSVTSCEQEGSPPYGAWDWGTQQPFCELSANCQLPQAPDYGALACDYWLGGRFCQPQCQTGYDISARSHYVDLLVCNDDGSLNWNLPLPNCMPSRSSGGTRRSVVVFFTGSCSDEATQTEIKQNFIEKLSSTSFSHGCGTNPKCSWKYVQVICGNTNGKRATTGVTITFEIALNSSTPMDEDEYYSQYMEYSSLIETLEVDVASGTLTIQMSDNTTMEAAEMVVRDIGLQCEENTVASTKTFTCVECQSGSYYDATTEECVLCPVGQYQAESRQNACIQCPHGTSTATTGSTSQTNCLAACPPGSWSPSSLPPCTPCDVGYYHSGFGATGCTACPGNKITKTDNSSIEMDCVDFDVYFPDNQTAGVLFTAVETVPVMEYTVVWWQQCSSGCTGEVFVLKNATTGAKSLTVTFSSTITISVDGHTTNSGLTPPDDGRWHVFTLKRKHTFLECFMDMSLVVNVTGISEQGAIGGVIQLGGISFEGTISQLNIFTESIPLATDKCSNAMFGDVFGWRSTLNATMNDAFIQIPSVCDDVNECDSSPCIHGNCSDEYNRYQCECDVGFTGSDCDVDIDDCEANSCQNNATCQDSVNNYTCQCLPNFTGALCEIALVDGDWNAWGNWTECSVTCGNGTQTRVRACDNPAPDNGGAECAGDGTETEVCVQESCPECGELVPPVNGSLSCTNDGEDTVCELDCDDGFVTDIPIPDNYTCGNSTFDQWDFKLETNVFTRLPSCVATTDPDDMRATRTSYYQGLDCSTLSSNSDARIAVMGKLGAIIGSVTGVKDGDCKEDQKSINTCEVRRKRDTSSDSAAYTIVIHCDSKSKGAAECYEILTQAIIELESLEEQGEMNVVIDGIEYIVNVSLSVADTNLTCPVGMVEVISYCVPCGPGRYYSEGECVLCELGEYQDTTQQTSCKACPTGTSTEGTGSISVAECTVILPVEDSGVESAVLAVTAIAGIVAGVVLVVLLIMIITVVRLTKSKKKISDSTLFQKPCAPQKGYERESTTASAISITDLEGYYPTRADTSTNTRWTSSSWKDDDNTYNNMFGYSQASRGHVVPPLATRDPHPIPMTSLSDSISPLFRRGRPNAHALAPLQQVTNPVAASISTIDILPLGDD